MPCLYALVHIWLACWMGTSLKSSAIVISYVWWGGNVFSIKYSQKCVLHWRGTVFSMCFYHSNLPHNKVEALNQYLLQLRRVVFSRCYDPNSPKASQEIVCTFTIDIQCELVGHWPMTSSELAFDLHVECFTVKKRLLGGQKIIRCSRILVTFPSASSSQK